jgi:hypothetical protein
MLHAKYKWWTARVMLPALRLKRPLHHFNACGPKWCPRAGPAQLYFSHHLSRGGGLGLGFGTDAFWPQMITRPHDAQCHPTRGCFSIQENTDAFALFTSAEDLKNKCSNAPPVKPQPKGVWPRVNFPEIMASPQSGQFLVLGLETSASSCMTDTLQN